MIGAYFAGIGVFIYVCECIHVYMYIMHTLMPMHMQAYLAHISQALECVDTLVVPIVLQRDGSF